MQQMSKTMGWLMLALNLVLLILIGTMHNMAAMWLMGLIMNGSDYDFGRCDRFSCRLSAPVKSTTRPPALVY